MNQERNKRDLRLLRKPRNLKGMTIEDLLEGTPDELEEVFIKYIVDSHVLAEEPEFIDLYFDKHTVLKSLEKIQEKYEKQLLAAEKVGGEKLKILKEDMLIEAVNLVLTPSIRKNISHRLDVLVNRLVGPGDTDKYIMVSAVQEALKPGSLPWGVCNLVVTIFNRSIDKALKLVEDWEVPEVVSTLFGEDITPEEFLSKVDDPGFIETFQEKIDSNPDLYKLLTAETDKIIDEFLHDIWNGRIELNLFTVAEIERFSTLLDQRLEEAGTDFSKDAINEAGDILFSTTRQYIEEIVTPRRLDQIKKSIQKVSKEWMEGGHRHAFTLSVFLPELNEVKPSENDFILTVMISQFFRMTKSKESDLLLQSSSKTTSKAVSRGKTKRGRRGKKKR